MNDVYSVYVVETGALTGAQVQVSDPALLVSAVPEGCSAILGDWDFRAWKVVDGAAVAIAPAGPDWRRRRAEMAGAAYGEMLEAEAGQGRALREIVRAMANAEAPPADAMASLADIEARINVARTRYRSILEIQSPDQLDRVDRQ